LLNVIRNFHKSVQITVENVYAIGSEVRGSAGDTEGCVVSGPKHDHTCVFQNWREGICLIGCQNLVSIVIYTPFPWVKCYEIHFEPGKGVLLDKYSES